MRICLDVRPAQTSARNTGIGIYVKELGRALARIPTLDVRYLVLRNYPLPDIPFPESRAIWVSRPSRPERWHSVWDLLFLGHKLVRAGVDIYHATAFSSVAPRTRLRVVSTVHDVIPLIYPQDYAVSWDAKLLYNIRVRKSLEGNRLIAVSDAAKRDIVKVLGVGPGRVSVTHLAAGVNFKAIGSREIEVFRCERGLPARYIFYIGGYSFRKNVSSLLRAYAHSGAARRSVRLLLAGKMSDETLAILRVLSFELGISQEVIYFGNVNDADLPRLYSAAEFFVYPSTYEGFGLPVLEAMACGTAVIAGYVSSIPEVAGNAALLVNPESTEELSAAMKRLIEEGSMREDLSRRGRARAAEFSWDRCARETVESYHLAVLA